MKISSLTFVFICFLLLIQSSSHAQIWPNVPDGKPLPDLAITFVEFDSESLDNIRFGVKNKGKTPVHSFEIEWFLTLEEEAPVDLTSNPNCKEDALLLRKKLVKVKAIAAGKEMVLEEKRMVFSKDSACKAKFAKGYLGVYLDSNSQIKESNENNNYTYKLIN